MYRLVLQRRSDPEASPFEGIYRYWRHLMRQQLGENFDPSGLLQSVAIYQHQGYRDERYAEENVILEWCKTEQFVEVYTNLQLAVDRGEIDGRLQEPADGAGPYRLLQELNKVHDSGKAVCLLLILASLKSGEHLKFFNGHLASQSHWDVLLTNLEAGLSAFFNYVEYDANEGELCTPINLDFPHRSSRLFPGCVVLNKAQLLETDSDPDLSSLVWFFAQDHAQRLQQMTPVRVAFGLKREMCLTQGPRILEETPAQRDVRVFCQETHKRLQHHVSSD